MKRIFFEKKEIERKSRFYKRFEDTCQLLRLRQHMAKYRIIGHIYLLISGIVRLLNHRNQLSTRSFRGMLTHQMMSIQAAVSSHFL
jgi:hypothetical protein